MLVTEADSEFVTLIVNRVELELINNALNEVCNGVRELGNDTEFEVRLGSTRLEVTRLLEEVHAAVVGRA